MTWKRFLVRLVIVLWFLAAFSLVAALPALSQAAPDSPAPVGPLPPRFTPVPGTDVALQGATIALRVPAALANLWTAVQWQDGLGAWHDVEGWQGTLDGVRDGEGRKDWWVAQKDWGTGPFRWTLHQEQGDPLLAASAPFYLPGTANQRVSVNISAAGPAAGPSIGGAAGVDGLPQTGGTLETPTAQWLALLLALVGLLALLGTPWCVAQSQQVRRR